MNLTGMTSLNILCTLVISLLSFIPLQLESSVAEGSQNDSKINSTFNFVAAGDWGCDSKAHNTVNNIQNRSPEIVLALGDLSYQ